MSDVAIYVLPPVLDLRAAAPLKAELLALAGAPLIVDGSKVERLGGQCLQVLAAAANAWRATGHGFCIRNASAALLDDMRLMDAGDLLPMEDSSGSAAPC